MNENIIEFFIPVVVSSHSGSTSDTPKAYSPSVLLQLPVKRLLQHVTNNQVRIICMHMFSVCLLFSSCLLFPSLSSIIGTLFDSVSSFITLNSNTISSSLSS